MAGVGRTKIAELTMTIFGEGGRRWLAPKNLARDRDACFDPTTGRSDEASRRLILPLFFFPNLRRTGRTVLARTQSGDGLRLTLICLSTDTGFEKDRRSQALNAAYLSRLSHPWQAKWPYVGIYALLVRGRRKKSKESSERLHPTAAAPGVERMNLSGAERETLG